MSAVIGLGTPSIQRTIPPHEVIAISVVSVTASPITTALPSIVNALTNTGRVDAAEGGYIVAIDLASQVSGALIFLKKGYAWRLASALSIGIVLMALGNIMSCFAPSTLSLMLTRIIAGGGVGVLRSGCTVVLGRSRSPTRAMAMFGMAQIVTMSAAFATFPTLIRELGWYGPYMVFSVLGLLTFLTARWWPRDLGAPDNAPLSLKFGLLGGLSLFATFAYFVAVGGVWAFISAVGASSGQTSTAVESALKIVAVPGLVASLLAWFLGTRITTRQGAASGGILTIAALTLLIIRGQPWLFEIGLSLFYFAWCSTIPFQFAATAASDRSGNSAGAFSAAHNLGLAVGAAVAGAMVVAGVTSALVVFVGVCTMISTGVFAFVARTDRSDANRRLCQ